MSEHKEQIKKEISVQWDQFTTVNNLQYIENIGLLRRPSFSLAALGFSKYETLISQLKVSSIAYIHDRVYADELYHCLEKLNFHFSKGNINDIIKLVHNDVLILVSTIGVEFPKSLHEPISLFDSLILYCIVKVKEFKDIVSVATQDIKQAYIESSNKSKPLALEKKNDNNDAINVFNDNEFDSIDDFIEQECLNHFAQNRCFMQISKCLNLFLVSLTRYRKYANTNTLSIFAFLYRLSDISSSVIFIFENWFTNNTPPEPDVMMMLNKCQIISSQTNYAFDSYFPLYDLAKEHIFSDEPKLLITSQGVIKKIVSLANKSEIIANWIIMSDLTSTVMNGLFSFFNQCCYDPDIEPCIDDLVRGGPSKVTLDGSLASFSEYLLFVSGLLISCKDEKVKVLLYKKFENVFDRIAEQFKIGTSSNKYAYKVIVLHSLIVIYLFPHASHFEDLLQNKLLHQDGYFLQLLDDTLATDSEKCLDTVELQKLEIFTMRFAGTLITNPEFAFKFGQVLFFDVGLAPDPNPQATCTEEFGSLRVKSCALSEATRHEGLRDSTIKKFFYKLCEMNAYYAKFYGNPYVVHPLEFNQNKTFSKFILRKLVGFFSNSYMLNEKLVTLFQTLFWQTLNHNIHLYDTSKTEDITEIMRYLYSCAMTYAKQSESDDQVIPVEYIKPPAIIEKYFEDVDMHSLNLKELKRNSQLFTGFHVEMFMCYKLKNYALRNQNLLNVMHQLEIKKSP